MPPPSSSRHLHLEDLLGLLPWIPAGPVVDIGCGHGHLSAALAVYGLSVSALDVDASALALAQKRYGNQVNWLHEDIRAHRLNRESQAAIFCLNILPAIPHGERARLIGRLKAAIKPGGILVLSGYTVLDPTAQERLATSLNRLDQRPTGVLALGELQDRLSNWDLLFSFEDWVAEEQGHEHWQKHHLSQIVVRKPLAQKKHLFSSADLPVMGAGTPWQQYLVSEFKALEGQLGYLELQLENWLNPSDDSDLLELIKHAPSLVRVRGVGQTLTDALPMLTRVLARTESPWWVISLGLWSFQSALTLPLPPSPQVWEVVLQSLRQLRLEVSAPFLLENSLASLALGLVEGELLGRLADSCDCGISLDLTQLCQFAALQGFEPVEWLRPLAAERVIALRLPGDTASPFYAEAWRLARQILRQSPIKAITVVDPPEKHALTVQLKQAQQWLQESQS
jgi:uncharacterized protein